MTMGTVEAVWRLCKEHPLPGLSLRTIVGRYRWIVFDALLVAVEGFSRTSQRTPGQAKVPHPCLLPVTILRRDSKIPAQTDSYVDCGDESKVVWEVCGSKQNPARQGTRRDQLPDEKRC